MFFAGGGGIPFGFQGGGGGKGGHPGMHFAGGIPFDFEGGGMPGGGRPRGKVENEKYYKLLEIAKDASESDIKKAFRKLAIKHHPDKGGDPETFKEITRAHEVLSDPEKRRLYDMGGEEAVSGEGGGGGMPTDVFDMMFGGGGRGGGRRRKTKDVIHSLPVTLEQLNP